MDDFIEWAAAQFWSNGRVGMAGNPANGFAMVYRCRESSAPCCHCAVGRFLRPL
ncbi:MAG: CocE/NonD family hydrolase [Sutterella wadsworthensis]